jgi:hypothetical protein
MLPKGARLSGVWGGDTCAIDEIETKTHESRRREPTEAYKGEKTKGAREGERNGHGAVLLITYYRV